jgi:chemotaxis-related protein WspB
VSGLVLLLSAGNQRYAVPCQRVREVIPGVVLELAPHAPPWFAGLFNYRGTITPVVDFCRLVGGGRCADRLSSRIVVFEQRSPDGTSRPVGLLAERVTETRLLDVRHRASACAEGASYLGEVVLDPAGMIHSIDLDRVVGDTLETLAVLRLPGAPGQHAAPEHREPA